MELRKFLIIIILFFTTTLSSFAKNVEELYLVNNTKRIVLENYVDNYLQSNNYEFTKKDGKYEIKTNKTGKNIQVIAIKQEKNYCYFYYLADKKLKFKDKLIKDMSKSNFPDITLQNNIALEKFVINKLDYPDDVISVYDFSDEAQEIYDASKKGNNNVSTVSVTNSITKSKTNNNQTIFENTSSTTPITKPTQNNTVLKGKVVRIPAGAGFNASIQSDISTGSLSKNDKIMAVLKSDWTYNGHLIAPAQSVIYGNIVTSKSAGLAYGNGNVTLNFNQILLPSGQMVGFVSDDITLSANGKRAGKIVKDVVSGVAVGALLGLVVGAIGGDIGKNVLIGAGTGTAIGGVKAVASRGDNVDIKEGTSFKIKLKQDLNITSDY